MAFNWVDQSGFLTNTKLNKQYRRVAQPLQKFRQFVDVKDAFGKKSGETVNWMRADNLGTLTGGTMKKMGGYLTETTTFHESAQGMTWGTLTVREIGNSIPFTFKVETLSKFDINNILDTSLVQDTAKCMDGLVERQFDACKLRYVGTATNGYVLTTNGSTTKTNTSVLNSFHVRKMRLELEKRNAPELPGGGYAMILSLEAMESLEGAMESVNQYTESGIERIYQGEVGRLNNVRFIKDSFASRFIYNATLRTAVPISWTKTKSLVGYMFGAHTIREAIVVPEHIRSKIPTDYGRSRGLAWYGISGFKIEWETEPNARIIKWDSNA